MTTDITELTQESARESGSILIIVAARMARREFFTPLHALCESGKRVVSKCPVNPRPIGRGYKGHLLKDVQKEFPDANFYTASGGFNLLLGSATDCGSTEGNQLIAISASEYLSVGDGDF